MRTDIGLGSAMVHKYRRYSVGVEKFYLVKSHSLSESVHPYQLNESISNFGRVWCIFSCLFYSVASDLGLY